jgi:hypothetical protein
MLSCPPRSFARLTKRFCCGLEITLGADDLLYLIIPNQVGQGRHCTLEWYRQVQDESPDY